MARWGLTRSGGNFLPSWVVRRSRKVDGGCYGQRDEHFPCIQRALTEGVICRRALE